MNENGPQRSEPELAAERLRRLSPGKPKTAGALAFFPLFWDIPGTFPYLTLGEALEKHSIVITEVSQETWILFPWDSFPTTTFVAPIVDTL